MGISRTRKFTPSPFILQKKMAFALQINAAAATKKKTAAAPKKTTVKKTTPVKRTTTVRKTTVKKKAAPIRRRKTEQELWYPNAEAPAWLDGSMPGDRGFDPFGLAKPVEALQFDLDKLDNSAAKNPSGNVIGKVKQGDNKPTERTIVPFNEATTGVAWQDAGKVELEQTQYLGFNLWGEVLLVGTLEFYRSGELDQNKRCYPGGAFDPFGLASKSAEETFRLKTAELKHGRLAMVAMFAVTQQALLTGEGALEFLGVGK